MPDINVTSFDEMAKTAQKLNQLSQNYKQISKELMDCATTMGSAWEGADNQAFVKQISGFTAELDAMSQKLLDASKALDKQRANYVARQDQNIQEVQRLKN